MTQTFTLGQLPVAKTLLDAEGVANTLFEGKKIGTVRKMFRDKVLHVHQLGGTTGRTNFTEENSARVRVALCEYLRRKGWKTGDAGQAIALVCGDDDIVVQTFVDERRPLDEIYDALKAEILKKKT